MKSWMLAERQAEMSVESGIVEGSMEGGRPMRTLERMLPW